MKLSDRLFIGLGLALCALLAWFADHDSQQRDRIRVNQINQLAREINDANPPKSYIWRVEVSGTGCTSFEQTGCGNAKVGPAFISIEPKEK